MAKVSEQEFFRAAEDMTLEVERSEERELPGAHLGQLYAQRFPAIRAKVSLARLLDEYADRLTVVGRAGLDLIWGLDRDDDAPEVDLDALLLVGDHPGPVAETSKSTCLRKAHFKNYRNLQDVRLDLGDLTVLVGANAAGKSSILDGLFRGSRLTTGKPLSVFSGRNAISRVHHRGETSGIRIELTNADNHGFTFSSGPLDGAKRPMFTIREGGKPYNRPSLLSTHMPKWFGGAALLRLDARQLARSTYSSQLRPHMRHDGLYLASVLAFLALEDSDRLARIVEGVQQVIPQVKRVRTPRAEVFRPGANPGEQPLIGNRLEVLFGETGWTPADQLSEGTLLTLGLHTMLTREHPPKLVLFDDIDRALHPNAQRRLIRQLMELASSDCQVVCSTHSPYILDPIPADSVRVVRLNECGHTKVSKLTDNPNWQEWKGEMDAGEFWQFVGDEWLETSA